MDSKQVPTNLQGLLRFALQYTKSEDAPNKSELQEMDEERRQFLEKVLKTMSVDIIEEFQKALEILESSDSSTQEQVEALEIIADYSDNIDFANNFLKLGGSKVIAKCLDSDSPDVRKQAANLIGTLAQNNPFAQKHFVEIDVLPKLISLLSDEDDVQGSAMHAISCLIRHHEQSLAAFVKIGGLECILGCLQSHNNKVVFKSCFLISAISTQFTLVRDQLIKLGVVEKLSQLIEEVEEYDAKQENILSALSVLVENAEGKRHWLDINQSQKLENIIKAAGEKPEFQEICAYSKTLLNLLTSDSTLADK